VAQRQIQMLHLPDKKQASLESKINQLCVVLHQLKDQKNECRN